MAVFQGLMVPRDFHVLEDELCPQVVQAQWKQARLEYRFLLHRKRVLQARPLERHQADG